MKGPIPVLFQKKELKEYDFGRDHPLQGDRFESFLANLEDQLGQEEYELVDAEPVSRREPLRIASDNYVNFTREFFNSSRPDSGSSEFRRYHSADNSPGRGSGKLERAARAVLGQAKKGCDLVRSGKEIAVSVGGGFHHAKPDSGEGFCIYNDVAYAGKYLLEEKDVDRVMILDTDAHAGNGTYEYFASSPEVLQVDIHQDPSTIYPGTGYVEEVGRGEGKGFTVNVPVPEGAGNGSYELVFEEIVFPVAAEFEPEVIVRNGGGDPYYGDPLTNLGLTMDGLNSIGRKVEQLRSNLGSVLVDLILSGYTDEKLHTSWIALISGLLGKKPYSLEANPPDSREEVLEGTREIVEKVKRVHGDYQK